LIRVLIVEDSAVVTDFLRHILNSDPDIEVAGTALDGEMALEAVERVRPDAITMDIHMPRMNGFEATRRIMETRPTPIVIVSGTADIGEQALAFRALEAGALAVLPRPAGIGDPAYEQSAADLVRTVKAMSEVKLVRRWANTRRRPSPSPALVTPRAPGGPAVVAIGASTGGPQALQTVLSLLPADFPAPILVVQHIASGFAEGFAGWLSLSTAIPVSLAVHGEPILPRRVYLAPDGRHLKVGPSGNILLTADDPENGIRPSVACLFRSVAAVYGANAIGVLLSGMGKDGARELAQMKQCGAVTFAQDGESSVIHGMPGEAIRLDGATYVLAPDKIAAALVSQIARSNDTARNWSRSNR
jgi:two-component system chemotaxis response regulator CheB